MSCKIEIARERLQRLDGFGMDSSRRKSTPTSCGPAFSGHTHSQARVDRVAGEAQVGVRHFVVFLAAHMGKENARRHRRVISNWCGYSSPVHVADDVVQQEMLNSYSPSSGKLW